MAAPQLAMAGSYGAAQKTQQMGTTSSGGTVMWMRAVSTLINFGQLSVGPTNVGH